MFFKGDAAHDHGGCCATRERAERERQAKLIADVEAANARAPVVAVVVAYEPSTLVCQLRDSADPSEAFTTRLAVHTAVEKSLRCPSDSRPSEEASSDQPADVLDDTAEEDASLTQQRLVSLKVPFVKFRKVARLTVGGECGERRPVLALLTPCAGNEEPGNEPWIKIFQQAAANIADSVSSVVSVICLPNNPTATCGDSECPWTLALPSNASQEERSKFNFAKQCLLPMMMFGADPVIIAWRGRGICGMICGKDKLSDTNAVNVDTLSKITGLLKTT